ncbi:MAG: RHS repeat domain-containing protein [Mangrovibacterium sp.]
MQFEYVKIACAFQLAKLSSSAIPLRDQRIIFNSFKQPNRISEGNYTAYYTYGVSNQRTKKRLDKDNNTVLERHYLGGCYEEDKEGTKTTQRLYLSGDYYTAPAVFVKEGSANWKIYYICKDYLGSITHVVAADGSLKQELSYDAWGRLRNPSTLEIYTLGSEPKLFLGRGYTGHEHLNCFGLIHMNGRLYDPAVGRFLSPDNYVQASEFTQNYNRYSYCLNNPLKYNDPDGEFVVAAFLIGMAISATIDYGMQVAMNYSQGYSGKDAWVKKVDFFDVALSGTIGGLTAGWGASIKAGETVGKIGTFAVNNAKYVKVGEIVATSAVDITGEGWQPVTFNQFGQRAVIGLGTMYATDLVSSKLAKKPSVSVEQKVEGAIGEARSNIAIQFGKTENQVYHAFRHTDELGLDKSLVQSTVQNHFKTVSAQVVMGKPFNQIIEIGGQKIQYTAFKLSDGTFNIGRIHGIK